MTNDKKSTISFNKELLREDIRKLIIKHGGLKKFGKKIEEKAEELNYEYSSELPVPTDSMIAEYKTRRTPQLMFILFLADAFPNDINLDSYMI